MGMSAGLRRRLARRACVLALLPAGAATAASLDGARPRPTRLQLEGYIDAAAAEHGVSRKLVWAVIQAESSFEHDVVSPSGALGLMQLMPATAQRFGADDPLDARQNIYAGTRYLRLLLDTYDGDISLSAAAYNAGQTAVARYKGIPPFRATRAYVRRVNALLGPPPAPPERRTWMSSVEIADGGCPALRWGLGFGWPGLVCPALQALQRP
jgi:soluble lytic murein transglycosylase-like protein